MHDYILSCCSAADVTQEKLDAMDVRLLCNDFSTDGEIEVNRKAVPRNLFFVQKGLTRPPVFAV